VTNDGFRHALRRNIERGSAFCVRGEANHPLLGGLLWSAHPPTYEIGWLAVCSSARRRGVASLLVGHVLSSVKGPASVIVTTFVEGVSAGEPARALYKRFGFTTRHVDLSEPARPRECFELVVPASA
jgi:ribosomal protein S18 acetylase RimI-like enzyme